MTKGKGRDPHQANLWAEHHRRILDMIMASYANEKGDLNHPRCTMSYLARESGISRPTVSQHVLGLIGGGLVRRAPDGTLKPPQLNPVIAPLLDNLDERFLRDCPTCAQDMATYREGSLKNFSDFDSLLRSVREKAEGDLIKREKLFRDFYQLYRGYLWARHLDSHSKKPGLSREGYIADLKYYLIGKLATAQALAESSLDEKEKSRLASAGQSSP